MRSKYLCLIAVCSLIPTGICKLSAEDIYASNWQTHSVSIQAELSGALTRISSTLLIQPNSLLDSSDPATSYRIAIPDKSHGNLSWLSASLGKGANAETVPIAKAHHDLQLSATIYNVLLPAHSPSQNITLNIKQVFSHLATPLPRHLEQTVIDGQYFYWQGPILGGLDLLHDVQDAKVRVRLPSPQVKSISLSDDTQHFEHTHSPGSATIVFAAKGPIGRSKRAASVARIHYFQPEPVMAFRDLKRSIQVSHWASSISFEDQIEMVNNGPILKGHFARIDHQKQAFTARGGSAAPHIMSGLSIPLPPHIYSPYYIDTVGNVSTSRFRESTNSKKASLLELRPRYPLLGGWTYNFTIGYSAPLQDYLRVDQSLGEHLLRVPFLTAVKDIPIDHAEVRISLPENAQLISIDLPFVVDSMHHETLYTYLDTTGHPTIVIRKRACSDLHNLEVIIKYKYTLFAHLQKPAAVAGVVLLVFVAASLVKRLDWDLKPKQA